jgi:hypothetical protein
MPLVIYLATDPDVATEINRALAVLESYILRRDICGLTTKNYNRFFVSIIDRLRSSEGDKINAMVTFLSGRHSDTDRWPDDTELQRAWLSRAQYQNARQPRLRYIFEAIELANRSALNEDIDIKSALSIEHIMPQKWKENWPIPEFDNIGDKELNPDYWVRQAKRDRVINTLGNLTLLTHPLNASVSNGPFSVKLPAVRAHSSLALNRELNAYDEWTEEKIVARGMSLFSKAKNIWAAPVQTELAGHGSVEEVLSLPPDGTLCKFLYAGRQYDGVIKDGRLLVEGIKTPFGSLSAASRSITQTSRNGWNDWQFRDVHGHWMLANEWRQLA